MKGTYQPYLYASSRWIRVSDSSVNRSRLECSEKRDVESVTLTYCLGIVLKAAEPDIELNHFRTSEVAAAFFTLGPFR